MAVAAGGAAVIGALASGGGGAGLLEGFKINLETSGFGKAMSDMNRFNKGWDNMNKQLQPAANLWNKVTGVMNKGLGVLKGMLAPLAIAGGLFAAFFLAGEAGRGVFGAFGSILGAFSNILVAALIPAIEPMLTMLADLLPIWQEIFGSPEWAATMAQLGVAVATLVQEGLLLFIDLLGEAIRIFPIILPLISDIVLVFADLVRWLRETGLLQTLVGLFVQFAGIVINLVNSGFLLWLEGMVPILVKLADKALLFLQSFSGLDFSALEGAALTIIGAIEGVFTLVYNSVRTLIILFNQLRPGLNSMITAYNVLNAISIALGLLPSIALLEAITVPPSLQQGGVVARTGFAVVHEGEVYSGVGPGSGMGIHLEIHNLTLGPGVSQQDADELIDYVSEELRRRWIAGISTPR